MAEGRALKVTNDELDGFAITATFDEWGGPGVAVKHAACGQVVDEFTAGTLGSLLVACVGHRAACASAGMNACI